MNDDLLTRFKRAGGDPEAGAPVPVLTPPDLSRRPESVPEGSGGGRLAAGVVAVLAAGIAALLVVVLQPSGQVDPDSALLEAGTIAAGRSPVEGVVYQRTEGRSTATMGSPEGGPYSLLYPRIEELWVREDGSGRERVTYLEPVWSSPRDRRVAERTLTPSRLRKLEQGHLPPDTDRELTAGDLFRERVVGRIGTPIGLLPGEPDALRFALGGEEDDPRAKDYAVFTGGAVLLLEPAMDPELRSAAYEVLAGVGGVELQPEVEDPEGRPATAASISFDGEVGETATFYFDPETSEGLAATETVRGLGPGRTSGFEPDTKLLGSTVVEERGVVESIEETP
ncbi:MAG: hypothetical protein ACR2K6_03585 [Solirubrobacterales bacterium]